MLSASLNKTFLSLSPSQRPIEVLKLWNVPEATDEGDVRNDDNSDNRYTCLRLLDLAATLRGKARTCAIVEDGVNDLYGPSAVILVLIFKFLTFSFTVFPFSNCVQFP